MRISGNLRGGISQNRGHFLEFLQEGLQRIGVFLGSLFTETLDLHPDKSVFSRLDRDRHETTLLFQATAGYSFLFLLL